MFVTIFSSSVGGFTPSGAYFIVTVAKTCLVAGTISWGVHACCSPKPSFHGRGQHLTITETNLTPCQVLLRSLTLKHRSPVVSQQKILPILLHMLLILPKLEPKPDTLSGPRSRSWTGPHKFEGERQSACTLFSTFESTFVLFMYTPKLLLHN